MIELTKNQYSWNGIKGGSSIRTIIEQLKKIGFEKKVLTKAIWNARGYRDK